MAASWGERAMAYLRHAWLPRHGLQATGPDRAQPSGQPSLLIDTHTGQLYIPDGDGGWVEGRFYTGQYVQDAEAPGFWTRQAEFEPWRITRANSEGVRRLLAGLRDG